MEATTGTIIFGCILLAMWAAVMIFPFAAKYWPRKKDKDNG